MAQLKPTRQSIPRSIPNRPPRRVWLITWEGVGGHVEEQLKQPVACILSSRVSPKRVKELTELLYVNSCYSLEERLDYASQRRFNPYPAYYGTLEGITWQSQIYCGHNPYLFARFVEITGAERTESGDERLLWNEFPRPTVAKP